MENFCKGIALGMITGIVVGGIVVAKNKKLSNKLREGLTTAEGKIKEVKETIEEKIEQNSGCSCPQNGSGQNQNYAHEDDDFRYDSQKNNFSKKNKND